MVDRLMRCIQAANIGRVPWCMRLDKPLASASDAEPVRDGACPLTEFTDENCNQNQLPATQLGTSTEIYKSLAQPYVNHRVQSEPE